MTQDFWENLYQLVSSFQYRLVGSFQYQLVSCINLFFKPQSFLIVRPICGRLILCRTLNLKRVAASLNPATNCVAVFVVVSEIPEFRTDLSGGFF
jgi:hypothetical protein